MQLEKYLEFNKYIENKEMGRKETKDMLGSMTQLSGGFYKGKTWNICVCLEWSTEGEC